MGVMDWHGVQISPETIELAVENGVFSWLFFSYDTLVAASWCWSPQITKVLLEKQLNPYAIQIPHDKLWGFNFFEIFNPAFLKSI